MNFTKRRAQAALILALAAACPARADERIPPPLETGPYFFGADSRRAEISRADAALLSVPQIKNLGARILATAEAALRKDPSGEVRFAYLRENYLILMAIQRTLRQKALPTLSDVQDFQTAGRRIEDAQMENAATAVRRAALDGVMQALVDSGGACVRIVCGPQAPGRR